MEIKNYKISADIVRIVAIFGAIGIHIAFPFYGRWDFIGGKVWWITNLWNAFARTSIPLFILLSGYFILNNQDTIQHIWQRIFKRILIPLFAWSLLYSLWNSLFLHHEFNWLDIPWSIFHGGLFHYYFLGIIVGLYAMSPIFKYLINSASKDLVNYMLKLFLFGSLLLNFYLYATGRVFGGNTFVYWLLYAGYFLSGGLLKRTSININRIKLWILFLIYWIFTSLTGWLNLNLLQYKTPIMFPTGAISPYFDHYVSPNVMIMSIALFILIMQYKWNILSNNHLLSRAIKSIASASFGMYLIHPFVIDFMYLKFFIRVENLLLLLFLKIISTYFISYILIILLQKIPKLNIILGIKS